MSRILVLWWCWRILSISCVALECADHLQHPNRDFDILEGRLVAPAKVGHDQTRAILDYSWAVSDVAAQKMGGIRSLLDQLQVFQNSFLQSPCQENWRELPRRRNNRNSIHSSQRSIEVGRSASVGVG